MDNKIIIVISFIVSLFALLIIVSIFMVLIDIYAAEPDDPSDHEPDLAADTGIDPEETTIHDTLVADISPFPAPAFPDDESPSDDLSGDGQLNTELLAGIDYSLKVIVALMIMASAILAIKAFFIRPLRYFIDF